MSVYPLEWTASCDEDGCSWWQHASNEEKAQRAMADHIAFKHPHLILRVDDHLEAKPCIVTIRQIVGGTATAWCDVCDALHVIDADGFKTGRGPWRKAMPAARGAD